MDELLRDDRYFDAYFNGLAVAESYHQAQESTLKANEDVANKNVEHRPQLDALRADTAAAFQRAQDLKTRWTQLEHDQQAVYKRFQPNIQLNRLRAATSEQDRMSEGLARSFLDGTMDDEDAFVRQYREMRRVWHQRALRSEAWTNDAVRW